MNLKGNKHSVRQTPNFPLSSFFLVYPSHLNSLLTREFLQKLVPVAGDFYSGEPKLIPLFRASLYSIVTLDTPVKPSKVCEMLSSVYSYVEKQRSILQHCV